MAQVMTDTQLESPQTRRAGDDLIDLADWLKAEEEMEAKAEAARLAAGQTQKKSKGPSRIEATTIVTGRPTTNNVIDANDLLTYAEPLPPVKVDLGGKNWVGQLFEYRQAHPSHPGPDYHESSPGLNLFTCLVSIGEHPSSPLGDYRAIFARKKDAKQYAAKLAVEWLIAAKHMPADGSVSFPKPRPQQQQQQRATPKSSPATQSAPSPAPGSAGDDASGATSSGPSFGQRVAELCTKLAMSPPSYVITAHADFQAMYSGYAVFENSPVVMGKVGEFWNVYGKKRAREACAERVLGFLEGIAADRAGRGGLEAGGVRVPDVERVGTLLD